MPTPHSHSSSNSLQTLLSQAWATLDTTSLVELPLARYRVPGSAFVVVCAALALDGLITRVRGARATLE